MIYGYLRVSSDKQDVNSQRLGVERYSEEHDLPIGEYITDEGVSGGKDPSKRNLGPLLDKMKEGDVIIASEISRLGRDLYMVMDILHHCMKVGCVIHTVKDHFTLGDDIQSKVLAFAFGLSAEIERQMIRQRTREGIMRRVSLGVLVGRPPGKKNAESHIFSDEDDKKIKQMHEWGVPKKTMAKIFGCHDNTISRRLDFLNGTKSGVSEGDEKRKAGAREALRQSSQSIYKDGDELCRVELPRDELRKQIEADLTIPQIAALYPQFSYEQIYDTILCDDEFNPLYRKYGQKRVRTGKHDKEKKKQQ